MKNNQQRQPRGTLYLTSWITGWLLGAIVSAWPAMIRCIIDTVKDLKAGGKLFSAHQLNHWVATIDVVGFVIIAVKLVQYQFIYHQNMLGYLILALVALPAATHIVFKFLAERDQ